MGEGEVVIVDNATFGLSPDAACSNLSISFSFVGGEEEDITVDGNADLGTVGNIFLATFVCTGDGRWQTTSSNIFPFSSFDTVLTFEDTVTRHENKHPSLPIVTSSVSSSPSSVSVCIRKKPSNESR